MDISAFYSILVGALAGGIITIYKDNMNRKRHVIDKNKIRRLSKLNIKNIHSVDVRVKYTTNIEYFSNVIKSKLPSVDLTYFYRNVEDLIITEKEYISESIIGNYNSFSNIMTLLLDDKEKSINHELLHLSSSIINGKIRYSGFSQTSEDFYIGKGINEGYTSLLDKRYFNGKKHIYELFQVLASSIERIIGQEKMTRMYFEADLYGLIEELSKYCHKDTAYELIENIDYLFEKIYISDRLSEKEIYQFQQISSRISEILFSCYINKLKSFVQEGLITLDELLRILGNFSRDLAINISLNDSIINFLSDDIIEKNIILHFPIEEYNIIWKEEKVIISKHN